MPLDLSADAAKFMLDFAEDIVYRPLNGRPRTIKAVVNRDVHRPMDGAGGGRPINAMTITVANDRITGIASDEIDTGGDRIDVAVRVGGRPETRPIASDILNQDAGMLELGVR